MKIAITGGAGFLGRRLAGLLLQDPTVEHIVLADAVAATGLESCPRLSAQRGDISSRAAADAVVAGADIIFHLAAVVSGSAEADFDLGMRVNLDGTRTLLEAARSGGRKPIFVFASSLAVFGSVAGSVVGDDTPVQPLSSYGIQKAIGELLVSDYTRKGFVDGRVVRLPTVCVRPGRPNGAASSFVSGIIREPLNGERSSCPVDPGLELWLCSPGTAIENLSRAATVPSGKLGSRRVINLPGITVSVREMLDSLGRVGGPEALRRVEFSPDPAVSRIVSSWPSRFDVSRAIGLGFSRDGGFGDLISQFMADNARNPPPRPA